jgi:ring-1,2-phenylacetyl-CoA epoxidase subunit PaaC
LQESRNVNLEAIASKSIKEAAYHERFSGDWLKRIGDGTEESHQRAQQAVDDLWVYTDELFHTTDDDKACIAAGHGVDVNDFKSDYYRVMTNLLEEATLKVPENPYFQKGGKKGIHTEHMGYILTEMQYMQRTYPDMKW